MNKVAKEPDQKQIIHLKGGGGAGGGGTLITALQLEYTAPSGSGVE